MATPMFTRPARFLFRFAALAGAAWLVARVLTGGWQWRHTLEPSGLAAALLMAATLAVAPLESLLPGHRFIAGLAAMRRDMGLAAFGFAALHMAATVLALGRLDHVIQGLAWTSIWTGWAAFVLLLPPALSSLPSVRARLDRCWKPVQRLTWPAAAFGAWHWYLQARGDWLFWSITGLLIAMEAARMLAPRRPTH
ncbi:ferric reductase-like transmembrane domain-containing protein [Zhengella sp. ZM62]|uniref:ferric reductase-like transmembrane domain-containing protein n=1 Tax=Zhengella sedimenti TaxID=3390035 RepID=UPI003975B48B